MFESAPLLLLAVPALGAVLIAALSGSVPGMARTSALAAMLAVLALALRIFVAWDGTAGPALLDCNLPWMPSLGIDLHLGVDGFNLYLLLLCALLFPVVLAATWTHAESTRPLYLALLLILEASLLGTFLAQNLVLFFVFWEAVLIPMGILVLVFGGDRRRQAATVFFLYTLAGSVLLLAAVIALGVAALRQTGHWSFELDVLLGLRLDWGMQLFVFVAVMLACAVKCPVVPFHSWLPLAYYEAPAGVTALMAGVLSKMGAYGILRFALPLAPDAALAAAPYVVVLAVASILYGAVLALRQDNYKRLVAYSSLSHMGYIVLGIFSFQQASIHGALLQMLSHGVAVAGLFLLLGALQQRCGPAYLRVGALAATAPRFAVLLMLFVLTSVALPLTSGFTAEFLILFGAFERGLAVWLEGSGALLLVAAIVAASGMVLGAAYLLRFARAVLFGRAEGRPVVADLRVGEWAPLLPLLVLVLWLGVAPANVMSKVQDVVSMLALPATPATSAALPAPVVAGSRSADVR
jgi:NADH-quinone oxidoreductase subunit M